MSKQIEIRIAGKGGQGILTSGYLLGWAFALLEGKNVAQTQSYGPEARGGASKTDLIISDEVIYYTKVRKANYLILLSEEATSRYLDDLTSSGTLIIDSSIHFEPRKEGTVFKSNFAKIAREELKNPIATNLLMLGYFCAISDLLKPDSIKTVISEHFRKRFEEANLKAFDRGFEEGKKALKK
ncbi:2-oxoacid:acceptor oxidoreductase family protein [Candidatus Dependentiae bacterium]|nr:2-oxoacid:acceptor oxidoreductase family protein [Candidatus Dependentiae bacterium]